MRSLLRCLAIALSINVASFASGEVPKFELNDGDRVVFLGDGLIEQEQYHGWVELTLTAAYPEHNVTFRNLGNEKGQRKRGHATYWQARQRKSRSR